MVAREKIVSVAVAALVGAGLLYALTKALVLNPIGRRDDRQQALVTAIDELGRQNQAMAHLAGRYAALRNRTFDDTRLGAGVMLGRRINELAGRAGLGQADFTASTFTETGPGGHFSLVGCSVRSSRPVSLERLTHFLYLLKRDGYLHRVTSLDVRPDSDKRRFGFSLRYVTPVFDTPAPVKVAGRKSPTTRQVEIASLNTDQRAEYNVIHERNIFKPYAPRRPAPPTFRPRVRPPVRTPPTVTAPPAPGYDRLVVTGLPAFGERREVHLTVPGGRLAKVHTVGEKIPVGEIAMVDYRELPHPRHPDRLSSGRVIFRIGRDYWAVERGQPLGERRLLKPRELPRKFRPAPASRPAPTGGPAPKS